MTRDASHDRSTDAAQPALAAAGLIDLTPSPWTRSPRDMPWR